MNMDNSNCAETRIVLVAPHEASGLASKFTFDRPGVANATRQPDLLGRFSVATRTAPLPRFEAIWNVEWEQEEWVFNLDEGLPLPVALFF